MPIKVTTLDKLPLPTRGKKSGVLKMEEWQELRAKMLEPLKPYECVDTFFTEEQLAENKSLVRTFYVEAKKFVEERHMPYDVFRQKIAGSIHVIVACRPVSSKATSGEQVEVSGVPAKKLVGRTQSA